jgi:predicted enzyme related to lactoylglutathione lyase
MMRMPETVPGEAPSHWAVYFAVDDCAATASRAAELGGRVLFAPTEAGEDRFAVLEDPLGAVFSVLQHTA